jgi:uncharacterized membrane-anchored protein YhcB (DUF1043 family)
VWLFYVETYLFVLVAFAIGVAVGLTGVRLGVRRVAPAAPASRRETPSRPSAGGEA